MLTRKCDPVFNHIFFFLSPTHRCGGWQGFGREGAGWLTWRKKPPRQQDEGDSAWAGSWPSARDVWTPGLSVSCRGAGEPALLSWRGSPLRPSQSPWTSRGGRVSPLKGDLFEEISLISEKLEKGNFLAASHPRPSTGFISFNPTACPRDSPRRLSPGYDEVLEAMNGSCRWSHVGSHARFHTNWFCSSDGLLNCPRPPHESCLVC